MTVAEFLALSLRRPFAWGRHDCCLWLADWLVANGRPDPASHLRGLYADELGCARVLRDGGGLMTVVSECALRAGLAQTERPKAGDVGVVEVVTATGVRPVGALRGERRWNVLSLSGLLSGDMTPLRAWTVI